MALELSFREAVAADLPAILSLLRDDMLGKDREHGSDDSYREAFARIDANRNAAILLAERRGRIVGCAQVDILSNLTLGAATRGNIEGVRIASDLRGSGAGRLFFEFIAAWCAQRSCDLIQLTMNAGRKDAGRFYESIGFEPSHIGFKKPLPSHRSI